MNPGLIDRPFVPYNLISTQESPVPMLKFQMAPRLKILMASRSKKGTQIHFSFLSKVPANEPPPGCPTGPLWREIPAYRALCISLKNLIFLCSQLKEPSLKAPFKESSQRDDPPLEPSFIHLSKSPAYELPLPTYLDPLRWKGDAIERDARIQRLS